MTLVSRRPIEENRLVSKAKASVKAKPKQRKSPNVRTLRLSYDLEDPLTHQRAIEEIAAAFEAKEGVLEQAALLIGVAHAQMRRWMQKDPALRKRVNEIRLKHGNVWAREPEEES